MARENHVSYILDKDIFIIGGWDGFKSIEDI